MATTLTQETIDRKIEALQSEIIALRRLRNNLSSINSLPCEILTDIFFVVPGDKTKLTHVCQQWREVGLGCTALWAQISSSFQPQAIEAFLKRSGRSELSATVNLGRDLDERKRMSLLLLKELPRIRHLSLTFSIESLKQVFGHLSRTAPLLRTLAVTFLRESLPDGSSPGPLLCLYPPISSAPVLRKLEFNHCWFSMDWSTLNSLTNLSLSGLAMQLPVATLWQALRELPLLQDLELWDSLHPSNIPQNQVVMMGCADLPNLNRLHIDEDHEPCLWLLLRVKYAPNASVNIRTTAPPYPMDGFAALSALQTADEQCRTTTRTSPANYEFKLHCDPEEVYVRTIWEGTEAEPCWISLCRDFTRGLPLPLAQLSSFHLAHLVTFDAELEISSDVWAHLSHLAGLRQIVVSFTEAIGSFLHFLTNLANDNAEGDERLPIAFPGLKVLCLQLESLSIDQLGVVYTYLQIRVEGGCMLHRLVLPMESEEDLLLFEARWSPYVGSLELAPEGGFQS